MEPYTPYELTEAVLDEIQDLRKRNAALELENRRLRRHAPHALEYAQRIKELERELALARKDARQEHAAAERFAVMLNERPASQDREARELIAALVEENRQLREGLKS